MMVGRERARLAVEQSRNRLDEDRTRAAKTDEPQTRRDPKSKQQQGFARRLHDDREPRNPLRPAAEGERQGFPHILDNPEKL